MDILKVLKTLKRNQKITMQEYRTYKGQVLSGAVDACKKGLERKHLI